MLLHTFEENERCVKIDVRQNTLLQDTQLTGMRKFRIDQDFLIEHWYMIYIMLVVFAEMYFGMKLNPILDIN